MTRGDVKGKSRGLEKLLVAVGALEREVSFVLLEMVVHSVLTLLRNTAVVANVEAGGILLIDIGHWVGVGWYVRHINFCEAPTTSVHSGWSVLRRSSPLE
jgi:hypothetical protein